MPKSRSNIERMKKELDNLKKIGAGNTDYNYYKRQIIKTKRKIQFLNLKYIFYKEQYEKAMENRNRYNRLRMKKKRMEEKENA